MTELIATLESPSLDRTVRCIRVGLLGRGTVGQGLCSLLTTEREKLERRHRVEFSIRHVLVRNKERDNPDGHPLTDDAEDFLSHEYDVVVEAMGGVEPAGTIVSRFLKRGVPVVTANKALIAEKGAALIGLAERNGTALRFEASVAAGIPILGLIDRSLQSLTVRSVHAVLNGTSNFILTRIGEDRASLEQALEQARCLGYAEADPSLDLSGVDAAQKLTVLLRTLGHGLEVRKISVQGLKGVDPSDCLHASHHGYTLKPLAAAEPGNWAFVAPALVRNDHPLAGVNGVDNGVVLFGEPLGRLFLSGPGAGALPTAASLLDDMVHLATSAHTFPAKVVQRSNPASLSRRGRWFLALTPDRERTDVDDLLDFVSACGISFRELREGATVTGITARTDRLRVERLEAALGRTGAVKRFKAYRVLDSEGGAR